MVPVPVTVVFVGPLKFHAVIPDTNHVPEPTAIDLVNIPDTVTPPPFVKVTLYPFASNVPDVKLIALAPLLLLVYASCRVTEPLGLSIKLFCVKVLPALVIVCVVLPTKFKLPDPVMPVPVPLIQLP